MLPYAYLTYGNLSVFHTWFRIGSATGDARFRITMGNDGGLIHISAADSSGKVAANNRFLILPASAASEAVLSDAMIVAQGGPSGDYTSSALAPGRYYVFATDDLIDKTPEAMTAVWRERSRGTEVEVTSGTTVEVKVEAHAILERH